MTPLSELPGHLIPRQSGYDLLYGTGLEIGAFHQPANLPFHCNVEYCDVQTREDAIKNFPELNVEQLVHVQHICDIDRGGLLAFEPDTYDFVIFNHVIEHIANPIHAVEQLFRITKPGGHIIISAPDKHFCSDSKRNITPFEHVLEEYRQNVTEVSDEHYIDFLRGVLPDVFDKLPSVEQVELIEKVRRRREHAHVWDSATFHDFLKKTFDLLQLSQRSVYLSRAEKNKFEYFSVWLKT